MIYTVTFNPAIDYVVQVEELKKGSIHRSISEIILCGGKGINVSLVLAEFGIRSKALGFIAGFTGKEIERMVREQGVETDFVELKNGCSRINIKLRSLEKESGETDINGQGPTILEEEVQQLYNKLDKLKEGDLLILAGSVPNSLPDSIYEKILTRISGKGIRVIVDAAKDLLRNVLKYQPFLIKPNHNELEELFGVTLKTSEDIVEYASKLKEMGAKNVLVSMAENGAVLLDENGREFTSREFAAFVDKQMVSGVKRLVFVVGGPYGFSDAVYARADSKLSLSRMTFNHEMVRLFFIEQLYRAMTIRRGEPYHHD